MSEKETEKSSTDGVDYVHDEQADSSVADEITVEGGRRLTIANAQHAAEASKKQSVRESLHNYPSAIFWSLLVSLLVIMEGYDTILLGNFFAYPQFQMKYGEYVQSLNHGNGGYQVTAAWQSALSNASGIGAFFGVLANGIIVNRFGMKRTLQASLIVLTCFLFMTFFANNLPTLLAGEILCGLPWGVFATSAPAYASEVLPLNLRIYLTSYTNMCFVTGQLIAAGVLAGLVNVPNQWSYRVPFALQWFWPVIIFPILAFAPESPWHLVRHGRLKEAEKSLRRLQRKSAPIDPLETLANIVHTNKLEKEMTVGTSYWDCFRGTELRRTEIACFAFMGQILVGLVFAYNSTYFFAQIGLSSNVTYNLNVGGTALALFGCFVNWFALMPYFGRRTIYIWGMASETVILMIIGILNTRGSSTAIMYTQAVLTLVWTFFFQLSIGQLGWGLPAEVGSTRLRQKTVCLARNAYYICSVVGTVLESYMVNPTAWNLSGYAGFFWGGWAFLMAIWAFFRLPETKGRTYEELAVLFAQGVSARKFASTDVNAFDEQHNAELAARARSLAKESDSRRGSVIHTARRGSHKA